MEAGFNGLEVGVNVAAAPDGGGGDGGADIDDSVGVDVCEGEVPLLLSLLRSVGGFREAEVINARGDHRGIVGTGDRDLNGVCICGVVVVGDGDRVGQRDGSAGIEEVEGIGDGVGPVDGSRSLDIGA